MIREKYFKVLVKWSILSIFTTTNSIAQDSLKTLTLEQAVTATMNNNRDIQLSKLDQHIAEADYAQANSIFLPQLGFSYTAMTSNNPLNAFGYKLQQKSITPSDFNPALLNHPSATSDFLTKLELQQPLLNMDMIYQRKAAAKQLEIYNYKTEHTQSYLRFEVQKAYMQLQLSYESFTVFEEALGTAKALFEFTENYFKQGLVQKSDLLNAQLQVSTVETQLSKAGSDIKNASDNLSELMGLPAGVVYKVEHFNFNPQFNADTTAGISENRPDFLAIQKAIESTDMLIRSNKMSYLPRLNAFANYQWNDKRMWGFGNNAYLAGVQLSWDIFMGGRTKNSIKVKQLEKEKLAETLVKNIEQSSISLNKANRQLADARTEISQQHLAIDYASESLNILQNRYKQGLVNTTEVLMAATQLSQQKFSLARAIFNYGVTNAYIQFLTSTKK
ncbi:MAG: TolC family protein [Bacteroidetes bacterium]|nr:TolC family protein [Bacteroidota bacterium]